MLPVLVVVLAVVLWAVAAVAAQLGCVDAARTAARAAARGEDPAVVAALARDAGPTSASVRVSRGPTTVTVRVGTTIRPPGFLARALPGLPVASTATAALEPGEAAVG